MVVFSCLQGYLWKRKIIYVLFQNIEFGLVVLRDFCYILRRNFIVIIVVFKFDLQIDINVYILVIKNILIIIVLLVCQSSRMGEGSI